MNKIATYNHVLKRHPLWEKEADIGSIIFQAAKPSIVRGSIVGGVTGGVLSDKENRLRNAGLGAVTGGMIAPVVNLGTSAGIYAGLGAFGESRLLGAAMRRFGPEVVLSALYDAPVASELLSSAGLAYLLNKRREKQDSLKKASRN